MRRHLAAADADLAALIERVGRCGLRVDRSREPYEALVRAIAHQQLHGRAAEAILGRMITLLAPKPGPLIPKPGHLDSEGPAGPPPPPASPDRAFPSPAHLLAADPAALRACGFSMSKIGAIRTVAQAAQAGLVPSRGRAARLADEVLIERLTSLRGIGRWTVEMLLIFSLGRPDIMPVDDFGVREGYRRMKGLDAQPRPRELARLCAPWSPYRSAAAWYLWRGAETLTP